MGKNIFGDNGTTKTTSKDFVLVATGNPDIPYTISADMYKSVGNRLVQACKDNPDHTEAIQEYFLKADRSDLFNPQGWHMQTYGNKDESIEFAHIIEEFDPNERLAARGYVGDKHLEKRLAELTPEV